MKAAVEILSGVVRIGPGTQQYGDPFEIAVAFSSTDGRTATIKALVAPPGRRLTGNDRRAMVKALAALGLGCVWERIR